MQPFLRVARKLNFASFSLFARNDEGHREVAGILQTPGEWMVADPTPPKEDEPTSGGDDAATSVAANEPPGKGKNRY